MKLAVVGSRMFTNYGYLCKVLEKYLTVKGISKDNLLIISGGAIGADSLARTWCEENNVGIIEHLPNYGISGEMAPIVRNGVIAAECDEMIAFFTGESRGTTNVINRAKKLGKKVYTVRRD